VCSRLKLECSWLSISLEENLKLWFLSKPKQKFVPFMVLWGIWLYRNNVLFNGLRKNVEEYCKKIHKALVDYKVDMAKDQFQVLVNPMYFGNSPIGFFEGASTRESSGIGVMIKLSSSHCFKTYMSIGVGTNIRAELLAFWVVLFLSKRLDLQAVYMARDSKVVIDWFNERVALNLLVLQP